MSVTNFGKFWVIISLNISSAQLSHALLLGFHYMNARLFDINPQLLDAQFFFSPPSFFFPLCVLV